MDRYTEKLMKSLDEFIALHRSEARDEESMNRLIERFFAEHNNNNYPDFENVAPATAEDYLELAEAATSKKKCVEYLRKAAELEPDNPDVQLQLIIETMDKDVNEQLTALGGLMETAEKQMEKGGYFRDYTGDFWSVYETRPYMRVCDTYIDMLICCGMMRRAIEESQRLLELCENDNLGVRYRLMHLYAYMEDELHALALHKQFGAYEETQMLLPLAVLYYKLNQLDKAEEYIKRLAAVNKDTKRFMRAVLKDGLSSFIENASPYGYSPFTGEELLCEIVQSMFLFESVPYFFQWAIGCLIARTKSAGKASAAKKNDAKKSGGKDDQ